MPSPSLKLYDFNNPTVEIGTTGNPIELGTCYAGQTSATPVKVILWNDKGGVLGADDAREIALSALELNIQNTWTSDGTPAQTFTATAVPLKSATVYVNSVKWSKVESFSSYGPTSQVFTLDLATGVLTFGNDVQGKAPANGASIVLDGIPDLVQYGKDVIADDFILVRSSGVIANSVSVDLELATKISNTSITVVHAPKILTVAGVWDNASKTGTNYYTGGFFNADSGAITLGTSMSATTPYVEYTHTIKDDAQGSPVALPEGEEVDLENPIPQNNGKILEFYARVPEDASTAGGVAIRFRVRASYTY